MRNARDMEPVAEPAGPLSSPEQLLPASGTWRPPLDRLCHGLWQVWVPRPRLFRRDATQRPTFARLQSCQLAAARTASMADLVRSGPFRFSSPFISAFGELLYR